MYKKCLKHICDKHSNKSNQSFLTKKVEKKENEIDLINKLYSK